MNDYRIKMLQIMKKKINKSNHLIIFDYFTAVCAAIDLIRQPEILYWNVRFGVTNCTLTW